MALELEDLLSQLSREGEVVSSGTFTLEIQHALAKLRNYQLKNPAHYILKLIQSAMARGATQLHLHSSQTRVSLRMDGVIFSAGELERLFGYLLEIHADRSLRALAIAVNSALGTQAREISLQSWDGHSGFRHVWAKNGPVQYALSAKGPPYSQFQLVRNLHEVSRGWLSVLKSDALDWLFSRRGAMNAEQSLVFDHCYFCHIPVHINNRPLSVKTFGHKDLSHKSHHWIERYYPCPPSSSSLTAPQTSLASLALGFHPGQAFGHVLAIPVNFATGLRLLLVEDGVAFQSKHIPLPGIGGLVVACGTAFAKDLSEFSVIEDQYYHDFLRLITIQHRQLLPRLASLEGLPPELARLNPQGPVTGGIHPPLD